MLYSDVIILFQFFMADGYIISVLVLNCGIEATVLFCFHERNISVYFS